MSKKWNTKKLAGYGALFGVLKRLATDMDMLMNAEYANFIGLSLGSIIFYSALVAIVSALRNLIVSRSTKPKTEN